MRRGTVASGLDKENCQRKDDYSLSFRLIKEAEFPLKTRPRAVLGLIIRDEESKERFWILISPIHPEAPASFLPRL